MKYLTVAFLICCSLQTWAQVEITPIVPGTAVYPGDVVEARIQILDDSFVNDLRPVQIRKWGDPQRFLFMNLSSWQKDSSGWHIGSKIVLGPAFAADQVYTFQIPGRTIEVRFRGWLWNPLAQQIDPKYDYVDIPLFSRSWIRKNAVAVSLGVIILLASLGYALKVFRRKRLKKLQKIAESQQWITTISEAKSLVEMSQLWAKRDELKALFPQAESEIRHFFSLLNRYQFRPSVADGELQTLRAQRDQLVVKLREVPVGV